MYSFEERMRAVTLYIQYHHRAAPVIRELGYPGRHMLVKWYKQYKEAGSLNEGVQRNPRFQKNRRMLRCNITVPMAAVSLIRSSTWATPEELVIL